MPKGFPSCLTAKPRSPKPRPSRVRLPGRQGQHMALSMQHKVFPCSWVSNRLSLDNMALCPVPALGQRSSRLANFAFPLADRGTGKGLPTARGFGG